LYVCIIDKEVYVDRVGLESIVYTQTVQGKCQDGNLLNFCLYIYRRRNFALKSDSEFCVGKEGANNFDYAGRKFHTG